MELSVLLYNLGRVAGIIGFICLSLLIFSGDTARFFDRFFGLDKIIKFQRKFSLFIAVFVFLHPLFFMASSQSVLIFLVPDFTILPLALGILALYIFIAVLIASSLYKRISYRMWQYIHIVTYILFFFALYHAVNWGSDYNKIFIKIIYGLLLVAIVIGIIYRTSYKLKTRRSSIFRVKEIKKETDNTFTLSVASPRPFAFKPGQFCFLRLNKDKLYARHPFTISSPPQQKDLSFTIKLKGRFTKIAAALKASDEVIVDGPFGVFTVKDDLKDLVFIAGGVGIAPFMSIIKDHIHKGKIQNVILLYGSKTENDIIFKNELDSINEKWFKKVYVISDNKESSDDFEQGYIGRSLMEKYIKNYSNALFYICGPEIMKDNVKKALAEWGVPKNDIFIEDFFW